MKPISLPKLSLLAKFTIISFLITAAIAIALGWGIQQQMEQNALSQATENTADQVSTILNQKLHQADLNGTLDPARYEQIDSLIRENVLNRNVVRVKIWSRDGLLLYSDEKEQIGRRFTDNDELEEALDGKIVSAVSPEKEENKGEREEYGRLFEVYVPLLPVDSNQVAGVYEIYQDMDVLEPGIAKMRTFVWVSIGIGFVILYCSLYAFVRNASGELIHRSKENERLYEETKIQLAERKRAEKELIKRTTQLETANKELEAFSYSVSHDLRAPLRAIDGFSRVMLEEYADKLDDEGKRYLNIVRDNTQKMGQLIEDLLALSRLGRKEMQVSSIDMAKLAITVFDELKEETDEISSLKLKHFHLQLETRQ